MKKILVSLLILGLIGVFGLKGFNDSKVYSESEDIFCEIPISIFSRYPAEGFSIGFGLLNKSEFEKKIIGVEFYKEDGSLILSKKIEEEIKGANIKLNDDEIRDKIGLIPPEKEIVDKAMNLLNEAKILEKGDERTKKVELAWYMLSMNYKQKEVEDKERENILPYIKGLYYDITFNDLKIKLEPPDFIKINIKITFLNPDNSYTSINKEVTLFYLTSLPSQWGWYPGDGHMHTNTYSDGWYSIMERRNQANNSSLKWIIITDHGWHRYYGLNPKSVLDDWDDYKTDCKDAQKATPNITVCPDEEIATSDTDSHYLGYRITSPIEDHTLDKSGVISGVNNQGGFGFVAHPYSTPHTWTDWFNYPGLRGIELISGGYVIDDDYYLPHWDYYLTYNLGNTMSDPYHKFCVGLSNSDEHSIFWVILNLGKNMTYIYTGSSSPPGTYRTSVYNALERGNAVASSDGSLLIHKITTGGTYLPGYYMKRSSSGYINVNVYAKRVITTCYRAEIKLVTSDGTQIDDIVYNQYEINKNYSLYVSHDTYVRAQITFCHYEAGVPVCSYCFSNPIFIDFPPYNQ